MVVVVEAAVAAAVVVAVFIVTIVVALGCLSRNSEVHSMHTIEELYQSVS